MNERPSTVSLLKQLGTSRPELRFSFRFPGKPRAGFLKVLPLQKSWPATIFVALMLGAFGIPLFSLDFRLDGVQDLFDLTTSLFTLFWMLGWSVGVLALAFLLLAMLFAREVLIVDRDGLRLRMEILNVGFESTLPRERLSNLRYVTDNPGRGNEWRGRHLSVDYLDVPIAFGSDLDDSDALALMNRIDTSLSQPLPEHLPEGMMTRFREQTAATARGAIPTRKSSQAGRVPGFGESEGRRSLYLLVAANLVPLAGAFLLDWTVADIMLLFWFESAIIGFFNILKMFRIAGVTAMFYSLFFIGHFGAFMSVHLLFIFTLFSDKGSVSLIEVAAIFRELWAGVLALFLSHAFSYMDNFIGHREYERLTLRDQMHKPYARIITMHITIIVGGFLVLALDMPMLALVLLIMLKVLADGGAHIKEHRTK